MANETTQQVEQKTLTVPMGSDSKATDTEVDQMFATFPAFMDKKAEAAANPERKTPTPATPEQKQELEKMLGSDDKPKEEAKPAPEPAPKTEVKPEPKVDAHPTAKPKETDHKFTDLSDDGINREVESLKTGKQETKERFATVLRELKTAREAGDMTKKEFEAAKQELESTKKANEEAAKKAVVPDEVIQQQKAEREELAMFRRQYQLDQDPEVKKNYDERVDAVEQSIAKTLTEAQVHPKAIELIQKTGGWMAFSRSKTPMAWTDVDPDDPNGTITRRGTQAEYAKYLLDRLDASDAATVSARSGEQVLIKDSKERFLAEEKKKASEYFQTREKQYQDQREKMTAAQKALDDQYNEWVESLGKSNEILKDQPIPDKASEADRKSIKQGNEERASVRKFVKEQSKTTSLDAYKDLVLTAAKGKLSDRLITSEKARAEAAEKKIAELEAQLTKIRSAGRTITKTGSITGNGEGLTEAPRRKGVETEADIMNDLEKFAQDRNS